ncbi:glycoside hydrolase family 2 [Mucilaginibacter sp. JRF]|uniref:glycoside hydrolase family 2 TIM barrel-domain containing protein n=1 Tax=Mucilaginibacter sp. JRF TaxID=2780088 RepID=UPI00187E59FA|nr:glycoside hydrolase family 2 TIM barrel-domain containing protein [Mucilaginibacter sp. JRF]MBE9583311.1 glycoside hydrolase family 2 [Mucilaginibacter sp. JRF]
MKKALLLAMLLSACFYTHAQRAPVSLAGSWTSKLDSTDRGVAGKWFNQRFTRVIKLPGTLDDVHIGEPVNTDTSVLSKDIMLRLSRRVRYTGPVWYQRSITIGKGMANAQLLLERVIWKTNCWIDGKPAGSAESLIAPQHFSLGKLSPGKHVITLRIDNRKQHDISFNDFAHAYTDGTQIIWNGVIGRMEISDKGYATFAQIDVTASLTGKTATAAIQLASRPPGDLYLQHRIFLAGKTVKSSPRVPLRSGTVQQAKVNLPQVKEWDEFNPNVYTWTFEVTDRDGKVLDSRTEQFGFRTLAAQGSNLNINGRPLFLRGTLECNIFPIQGHPPMERAGWLKVFIAAKQYGLNHLRFHSWCPPEAAFRVADSLGIYLHVELPLWSFKVGEDTATLRYLEDEAQQMIKNYGNHPSFCFWSMGNELEGDFAWLGNLVKKLKQQDNRHLYTTTTFSFQKGHGKLPEPADDFFITQYTDKGWVRGQGIFNTNPPDFKTDYGKAVSGTTVPLVIHEVGQYSVYPDLKEIEKYTGVLVPANFSAVRHDLRKKGMLGLAAPYLKASGKLSANLYKEEIERALKTPGVGGFQLLDLHDFPGQGTALVGILNAFWESKGIIQPEAFRQFCGPVVPLLRFDKASYTNTEPFEATAEIANYLNKALKDELLWTIPLRTTKRFLREPLVLKNCPEEMAARLANLSYHCVAYTVHKN